MRIGCFLFSALLGLAMACTADDGPNDNNYSGDSPSGGDPSSGGDTPGGDTSGGDNGTVQGTISLVETCPTFTPCGGTVLGTWHVSAACFEISSALELLLGFCTAATVDGLRDPHLVGTIVFDATTVTRDIEASAIVDVSLPYSCVSCACGTAATLLAYAGLDATCDPTCTGDDTCSCSINVDLGTDDSDTYIAAGNTLTVGGTRTYDYCVAGNEVQWLDTTETDPELGSYTAIR